MDSLFRIAALSLFLLQTNAYAAPTAGQPPSQGAAPVLRVLVPLKGSAPFDQALTELVKDFNASHSQFRVELVKSGDSFQSLRALIADHYAGDLPDLALVSNADVPTLARLGIVQPLPKAWIAAKKILPSFSGGMKCRGEPCSIPFQRQVPVWFFNRELLFRSNQNADHIPTSWPKISALAQKLHKPNELWGVAVPEQGEAAIARWSALGLTSSDFTPEAASDWVGRIWANPVIWLPGSPSPEEATRWFLDQKAVVLLGGLDQLSYLRSITSFRFGTTLPEGELYWFGTDFVVLGKDAAAHRAHEFLDYLYRPEISLVLFKTSSTLPITLAQSENQGWRREISSMPVIQSALSRRLKALGLEKLPPNVRDEFSNTVWETVELSPELSQRPAKSAELRSKLQKLLSTNSH